MRHNYYFTTICLKTKPSQDRSDDPSDIDGWKGPWAKFKDEKTDEDLAAKGEMRAQMDEILEKRRAKKAIRRANRDDEEVIPNFHFTDNALIKY